MSIVVGKVGKDKIYLVSDTKISYDGNIEGYVDSKILNIMGVSNCFMGGVGKTNDIQTLQRELRNKPHFLTGISNDNPIEPVDIGWKMMKILYDAGSELDKSFSINSKYLMIINKKLLYIEKMYTEVINNYFAIGSGSKYAFGALYSGASAKEAVYAAIAFDKNCGGNVIEKTVNLDVK